MHEYQRAFLDLALSYRVLRFGEFTLKSGRSSPYFFNAGLFDTGAALRALGQAYGEAALRARLDFDMLFGPAYKGIALAVVTAIALAERHGRDVPLAFSPNSDQTGLREEIDAWTQNVSETGAANELPAWPAGAQAPPGFQPAVARNVYEQARGNQSALFCYPDGGESNACVAVAGVHATLLGSKTPESN